VSPLATWPILMTKLRSHEEVAEQTMAFRFEKPVTWTFKTGQFIDLTLINPPETDSEGNTRCLYYIAGPSRMVGDLRTMLANPGVDEDDIRAEELIGY